MNAKLKLVMLVVALMMGCAAKQPARMMPAEARMVCAQERLKIYRRPPACPYPAMAMVMYLYSERGKLQGEWRCVCSPQATPRP